MNTIFFNSEEFEQVISRLTLSRSLLDGEIADINEIKLDLHNETGRFDYILRRMLCELRESYDELDCMVRKAEKIKSVYGRVERENCRMVERLSGGDPHGAEHGGGVERHGDTGMLYPVEMYPYNVVVPPPGYKRHACVFMRHEEWMANLADRICSGTYTATGAAPRYIPYIDSISSMIGDEDSIGLR